MRFSVVLNRDGGTLKTTDLPSFVERLSATLQAAGHSADVEVVDGSQVEEALARAASAETDVLLAGGGDGTISAAASAVMGTEKALAVLPAGTMNLFARSLAIPQSIDEAFAAFASGTIRSVDIATANGKPFVHQLSVGMHAKMVHLRDRMEFGSRLGKMRASAMATYFTFLNPPSLRVSLRLDGRQMQGRVSAIGITNNLLREGALPYADAPDGGVLGVYVTRARKRAELVRFFLNLMRRRWARNPHVEVEEAQEVILRILSSDSKRRCVIDGELANLERETTITIHPRALKVLVPATADQDGNALQAEAAEALG